MAVGIVVFAMATAVAIVVTVIARGAQTRVRRTEGGDSAWMWSGDGGAFGDSGCDSGAAGDGGCGDGGGGGGD